MKEKLKEFLYFTLFLYHMAYWAAITCIFHCNEHITDVRFSVKKIYKPRKKIDKQKFAAMMERLTK